MRRFAGLLLLATPYAAVLLLPSAANERAALKAPPAAKVIPQRVAAAATVSTAASAHGVAPASLSVGREKASTFVMAKEGHPPPGMIEVCGVGYVTQSEDGGQQALQQAVDGEATKRWLERTASGADERARVVAMRTLYQMLAEAGDVEALAASAEWADRFIRTASESRDPAVYAMGMQVCGRDKSLPACQLLSAEQWTRVDPDNALPWLHAADVALRMKDDATLQESLYRASTAKRVRDYGAVPMASLLSADQSGLPTSSAMVVAQFLAGVQAAMGVPGADTLDEACSPKAAEDANRRQVCSSLAELFAREPDALFELAMAVRLGRRIGWTKDRSDAVRERAASLHQVLIHRLNRPDVLGCETMRAVQAHNIAAAEIGEVAALTRYSASPPPPR